LDFFFFVEIGYKISKNVDQEDETPRDEENDNDTIVNEHEDDGNGNETKHHETNENSEQHETRTHAPRSIDPNEARALPRKSQMFL
jgi:hypothetical protein